MKTFTAASLLLASSATLAAAVPTYSWDKWENKNHGRVSWEGKSYDGQKWEGKPWCGYDFSSAYHVVATPDQVINGTTPTPGQPGARGYFNYGIVSDKNIICYDITLVGVTGPYQSPAKTATHIHQANKGQSGPPRIAFPNPVGDDNVRRSFGCLQGPFTTGVMANGQDSGTGFTVAQIEQNPANFFTDAHTAMYVPGVVRGQLG